MQPPSEPSTVAFGAIAAPSRVGDWALRIAIVVGLIALCWFTLESEALKPLVFAAENHRWARLFERPGVLWAIAGTVLLCVRTGLWFRYRPAAPATFEDAPKLTVVIPAFNEGPMVQQSIDSVAGAHYPRERLEIFVVDDGSTDDTWHHIQEAAARHPGVVTALQLAKNQGKRAALSEGFRHAKGDVLVTIDSDSVIEPTALLAIAGPFRNPRVGAVAGRVAVLNRAQGVIPRMLAVRFVLSFDLLRAAQSTYGTVYCCPGALTAYRGELVRRLLPGWMSQTFLGSPCTFGEDRAMTNNVLAAGYDTVYQRTSVVHTVVPTTYRRLCKMFLRWDRSYVREELRYLRILWHRPLGALLMSLVETVVNNARYPVTWASLLLLASLAPSHPLIVLRLLSAIGIFAAFNMLYYLHSEKSSDFVYGILYAYFSFAALFWIFPYAVVTVRARGWLTR